MRRSQPNAYSLRVSRPIMATTAAQVWARRRDWRSGLAPKLQSEKLARRKASAELAFMVSRPGQPVLRVSISQIQPIKTRPAMIATMTAATREKDSSEKRGEE